MTRRGIRLALMAALFVVFAPGTTLAQTGTIVDWGPNSYAWATNDTNPDPNIYSAGSLLSAVGVIDDFAGPLAVLEPIAPGAEYTYYITNLAASAATTVTVGGFATTYSTVWTTTNAAGPNILIYNSPANSSFGTNPPNATVPSTFTDGLLILSGRFQSLTVTYSKRNSDQYILGGNADSGTPSVANGVFTGGGSLGLVSSNGQPCPFRVTGGWLARPGSFPTGYIANCDGKIDIDCPTPAVESSWGRIKGQYR